ncbi:MAG: hypothetical protein ACUVWV_13115 [Thermodesulfobacteriota bacterium]
MNKAVDGHLGKMRGQDISDRRHGYYLPHLLTELGRLGAFCVQKS